MCAFEGVHSIISNSLAFGGESKKKEEEEEEEACPCVVPDEAHHHHQARDSALAFNNQTVGVVVGANLILVAKTKKRK